MRIGAYLPNFGELSLNPGVIELARTLERAGAESLWISDHLCIPEEIDSRYPYSADGSFAFPRETPWMEALATLAALAVATDTVELGTAILVASQRNPIELAKVTATIDHYSRGRLTLGVGSGWLREEVAALGYDPRVRGHRLDDAICIVRDCWTGRTAGHAGKQISCDSGLHCHPTPLHPIPILIGGVSTAALSRAARLGDGWLPDWSVARFDVTKAAAASARLDEQLDAVGRDVAAFRRIAMIECEPADAANLPDVAVALASLGFDEIIADLPLHDIDRSHELLGILRTQVSRDAGKSVCPPAE